MINRLLGILLLLLFSVASWAGKDAVFSTSDGAIRGYDPVAYFSQGGPVKGKSDYKTRYQDADWYFSSADNLALFVASPEQYAPQYGGYCSWAVSQGYTALIDPEAWTIREGKLYLNYSKGVQRNWLKDVPGNIAKANKNWPSLLN
jgi:YHS domain-containing protein